MQSKIYKENDRVEIRNGIYAIEMRNLETAVFYDSKKREN